MALQLTLAIRSGKGAPTLLYYYQSAGPPKPWTKAGET